MPLSEHFGGKGDKVAAEMKRRYGKDWKRVFYATDNKRKRKSKRSQHKAALEAMRHGR